MFKLLISKSYLLTEIKIKRASM